MTKTNLHQIGVDFGTTRTVVAACDRGNYPVVSFTGPGGEALEHYPSILAARDGEIVAGLDALAVAGDPGWQVLRSFKRRLSLPQANGEGVVELGGVERSLVDLIGLFLSALRRDLLERSNLVSPGSRAEIAAMIATPANSHSTQRFVTLAAFRAAGFEVQGMLNEPSAAGFEYAHRHRSTLTRKREHVAVYDLGGGTFDASLVQMSGRAHDVLGTRGIAVLGGDDFDQVLAELALGAAGVSRSSLDGAALGRLHDHCRELKERLNPSTRRISVDLASCLDPSALAADPVLITTADYYEACQPLIRRTIDVLCEVLPGAEPGAEELAPEEAAVIPVERAAPGDLAGIYVVGGASALPAIARALRERFGRRVFRSPYPSAAAAIGLAIALDDQAGFAVSDRFSRVLGVFREARAGDEVAFDPIFDAATALPSPGARAISERTYRAAHNVGHFRFVECGAIDRRGEPSGDITPYGEILFPFDPGLRELDVDLHAVRVARSRGEGPLVRERWAVDATGLVELTITDLETGYERCMTLGASS